MDPLSGVAWSLVGLLFGLVLVALVLRVVQRPELLVVPNARSSHQQPTPSMGGIAIVVVVLGFLFYTSLAHNVYEAAGYWCTAGLMLAVVGLWDDLKELKRTTRLLVQMLAVGLVLWVQFNVTHVDLTPVSLLWLVVLFVGSVWFVNLFNFMDGIDGIAASQCLVFCLGVQFLAGGVPSWPGELLWLTSGVSVGFLGYNWPPAKIFMGDVGSQCLGLMISALALYLDANGIVPLVASLILLAGFWFDATYTLCVRMLSGQKFAQAHRSHLYQRLAQSKGHLWTTTAFLIFALLWLLPLAWVASLSSFDQQGWVGGLAVCAAVLPLAVLSKRYRAGEITNQQIGLN